MKLHSSTYRVSQVKDVALVLLITMTNGLNYKKSLITKREIESNLDIA